MDTAREARCGHSVGGRVALHALYSKPQAFHSIVVASPSLELDGGVFRDEHAFVARLEGGKNGRTSRLTIVVGDRDADAVPEPDRALPDRSDTLSGQGPRRRFPRYAGLWYIITSRATL